MGSKWGNARQADGFDGLGRQGHNGHDQPGTASNAHHKSGTQPGELDITSRRWGKWGKWGKRGKWSWSRPGRSRRKVRKPDLACAFVDRYLYPRQSARHVQDYPAILTSSHFTNEKFPTAEIGVAAGSPSFFIGSISSETSAPTTSMPAERKNGI